MIRGKLTVKKLVRLTSGRILNLEAKKVKEEREEK